MTNLLTITGIVINLLTTNWTTVSTVPTNQFNPDKVGIVQVGLVQSNTVLEIVWKDRTNSFILESVAVSDTNYLTRSYLMDWKQFKTLQSAPMR